MTTLLSSSSSDQENDPLVDGCTNDNDNRPKIKLSSKISDETTTNRQSSEQPLSSLYRATELWIDELGTVSSMISTIEKQLHDEFATLSSSTSLYHQNQSIDQNNDMEIGTTVPIPDLLNIIERIQVLSKTMMEVQQSCMTLKKRRNSIVPNVLKQLEMNQKILDQVSKNWKITTAPTEECIEKEMIEYKMKQLEF